jgi:hypothetical protein
VDDYQPSNFFSKFNFFSVSVNNKPFCFHPRGLFVRPSFLQASRVMTQAVHMSPTSLSVLPKLLA